MSLESDAHEYYRKHKKIDYEEEEEEGELTVHVVYASVDGFSRIWKGAYQRRKDRKRDYGKV